VSAEVLVYFGRPSIAALSPSQLPSSPTESILVSGSAFGAAPEDLGSIGLALFDEGDLGALDALAQEIAASGAGGFQNAADVRMALSTGSGGSISACTESMYVSDTLA